MSDQATIYLDEPVDEIQSKLLAIYQNAKFKNYKIILSDKWLENPFDPDMASYNQWHFAFETNVSSSRSSSSSVTLFFKNDKLSKIQHLYNEGDIMN